VSTLDDLGKLVEVAGAHFALMLGRGQ
jgi:hypothetical protein